MHYVWWSGCINSGVDASSLQLLPLVTVEDDDEIGPLVKAVRIVTLVI